MLDLQGDAGSSRAQYEARWHTFVTAIAPGQIICMNNVPWITEGNAEHVKAIILYGTSGDQGSFIYCMYQYSMELITFVHKVQCIPDKSVVKLKKSADDMVGV